MDFFPWLTCIQAASRFSKTASTKRLTEHGTSTILRGDTTGDSTFLYLKITKYLIYGILRKTNVKYPQLHIHIFKCIRDTKLWDNESILHESSKHVHSEGGIISHFWWLAKHYKYHFIVNQGSCHEVVKEKINPFKRISLTLKLLA